MKGLPRHGYDERPAELDEVTVRPMDAYGALAYLRSRAGVMPQQIGANRTAATEATERALEFFDRHVKGLAPGAGDD